MKKFLLAILFVGSTAATCLAQNDASKFSIGLEAGLPIGDFKQVSSFVIGGSLKYDHLLSDGMFLTGSVGFSSAKGKTQTYTSGGVTVTASTGNTTVVPVKAGIKYFLAESFYAEGQVGAAFFTQSGGGTAFAYAPGIGYNLGGGIDLGVRYEAWSKNGVTLGQIGARIAYSF
jgi:hypothetical protein